LAEIVGALGVPHTPFFPFFVERDGPECDTARYFAHLRKELDALKPDVLVVFDTDHLNTFFFDNLPILAIGVTDDFTGACDEVRATPPYTVKSLPALAGHLHTACVQAGFDVAVTQKFAVDHSIIVPLHFLTPQMQIPVIPFWISGHVAPLPSARRCHELGRTLRRAIEAWDEPLRVVTMGSGSISLEVWGPRLKIGFGDGVPDPEWVARVCGLLEQGDVETLINESTPEKFAAAGNVAGELLNWIAMLGTIDPKPAKSVEPQMPNGHAYAVWS
jgi:aromatic ring-opening dioxygenase catalytic subunit (LigB family)